jgi:hypothetical protein
MRFQKGNSAAKGRPNSGNGKKAAARRGDRPRELPPGFSFKVRIVLPDGTENDGQLIDAIITACLAQILDKLKNGLLSTKEIFALLRTLLPYRFPKYRSVAPPNAKDDQPYDASFNVFGSSQKD